MTDALRIIALSPNDWFGQWVNRQQLLSRLSQRHHVVYSTGAMHLWDRGTAAWQAAPWLGGMQDDNGVQVDRPGRAMVRWQRFPAWDAAVVGAQARRLRQACGEAGALVAYICHPNLVDYVEALRPDFVVYHCYDLYGNQPGWNATLEIAERELLRRADLVFSPTAMLSQHLSNKAPREVRVLPNAADVVAIQRAVEGKVPAPADLARIPEPRIGYVGSVHPQLDYGLIDALAQRQPDWNFVFIGDDQKRDMLAGDQALQSLRQRPNAHFLGPRHRSDVPAYLVHMNVNMMFYRLDSASWTHVAYPLKLHEYLAAGRPVVSVPLPMIQEFAPEIAFVQGAQAWEAALAQALSEDDQAMVASRRRIAAQNSWEARTAVLDSWLAELPSMRERRLRGG